MKFKTEVEINLLGEGYINSDGEWEGDVENLDELFIDSIKNKISENLTKKLEKTIIKSVSDKINYAVDQLIVDILANFMDRQIQITDNYGKIIKRYEDVDELLAEKFDTFITQSVDKKGRPANGCSYDVVTRIEQMLEDKMNSLYKKKFERTIENSAVKIGDRVLKEIKEENEKVMIDEIAKSMMKLK